MRGQGRRIYRIREASGSMLLPMRKAGCGNDCWQVAYNAQAKGEAMYEDVDKLAIFRQTDSATLRSTHAWVDKIVFQDTIEISKCVNIATVGAEEAACG